MPSLRELKRKLKSVKSTQQITRAMKMVAAARLRRAQSRILGARPFSDKMSELLSDLLCALERERAESETPGALHPLLRARDSGPRGLLLITADRGLCGSFNTNLIRRALEFHRENAGTEVRLFCAGRKGHDFFRRQGAVVAKEYVGIFSRLGFAQAELIGHDLMEFFLEGGRDVHAVVGVFRSALQQEIVLRRLLPLAPLVSRSDEPMPASPFLYEPPEARLLEALLPRYLKAQVYRSLLESFASEMGARMTAMESATQNAQDLIEGLTLSANKIRQAAITKEISELVGGAEALA